MKNSIRSILRDWVVKKSFELPQVRGVHRLAISVGELLTSKDNFVTFGRLRNGFAIKLDLNSPDQKTLYYLRVYEDELVQFFRSILAVQDPVFIDIGASIGVFSLSVADLISERKGRIIAFEPYKSNYDYLSESIRINNLEETIQLHRKAVGNENRTVKMRIDERSALVGNALMADVDPHSSEAYQECEMIILDEFLQDQDLKDITAVKIDIEGWEYFALKGFVTVIEKFRPIIYGEFLQRGMSKAGVTNDMLRDLIKSIDYKPHLLSQKRLIPIHNFSHTDRLDLILVPSEREISNRY